MASASISEKQAAVLVLSNISRKNPCEYHLVPFEKYNRSGRLRSIHYNDYFVLCHLNTFKSAGWLVCRYYMSSSCPAGNALFSFNSSQGGTSRFEKHTRSHVTVPGSQVNFPKTLSQSTTSFLTYQAAMAVARDLRPVCFTDGKSGIAGYIEAVFKLGQTVPVSESINPKCLLPCAKSVRSALRQKAKDFRDDFRIGMLNEVMAAGGALTTDGLTLKVQDKHFYDLTLHYIAVLPQGKLTASVQFEMKNRTMLLVEGPETANGRNIRATLDNALKSRYDTSLGFLTQNYTMVTHNAAVMAVVALSSISENQVPMDQKWMGCIVHQTNTAMKACMEKLSSSILLAKVWEDFQACKKIVTTFKTNGWNGRLPPGYKLEQESNTRFGTFFYVVQRFVKSSARVAQILSGKADTAAYSLFASMTAERDIDGIVIGYPALEAITDAFSFVMDVQKKLEASLQPTIHKVLVLLQDCYEELRKVSEGGRVWRGEDRGYVKWSRFSREMCRVMLASLIGKSKVHDLWLVGSFLHPLMREFQYIPDVEVRDEYKVRAERRIRAMMRDTDVAPVALSGPPANLNSKRSRAPESPSDVVPPRRQTGKRTFSMISYADSHFVAGSADEVTRYNAMDVAGMGINRSDFMADDFAALRFWYNQKGKFPLLFKVARRVFATPTSSCASERVFSAVSKIVTRDRANTSASLLEDIIIIRSATA